MPTTPINWKAHLPTYKLPLNYLYKFLDNLVLIPSNRITTILIFLNQCVIILLRNSHLPKCKIIPILRRLRRLLYNSNLHSTPPWLFLLFIILLYHAPFFKLQIHSLLLRINPFVTKLIFLPFRRLYLEYILPPYFTKKISILKMLYLHCNYLHRIIKLFSIYYKIF